MDQLFDGLLVIISGCTALYCWALGRRLRALQNLKKGVGQAVVTMTQTISSVEANAQKLSRETTTAVAELGAMLAKVDAYEEKVDVVLETMDQQARQTWKQNREHLQSAIAETVAAKDELAQLLTDARQTQLSLARNSALIEQLNGRLADYAAGAVEKPQAMPVEQKVAAAGGGRHRVAASGAKRPWANVATELSPKAEPTGASLVEMRRAQMKAPLQSNGGVDDRWVNPFTRRDPTGAKKG